MPLNPRLGPSDLAHIVEPSSRGRSSPCPSTSTASTASRSSCSTATHAPARALGARRFDPGVALVQLTSGTTGARSPCCSSTPRAALLDNVLATLRGGASAGQAADAEPHPGVAVAVGRHLPGALRLASSARPSSSWTASTPQEFAAPRRPLPDPLDGAAAGRDAMLERRRVDHVAGAAEVRAQHHRAAVAAAGPPVPRPLRRARPQRLRARPRSAARSSAGAPPTPRRTATTSSARSAGPHAGVEVRTDEATGELQVRTPAMSAGYADGTDLGDRLTDDGWFRTGDVGRLDDEGFVWIEGRLSDMINRGGLKVFPGRGRGGPAPLARRRRRRGRRRPRRPPRRGPVGVRRPDVGASIGRRPCTTLEALCREHLAPYKVPVRFDVVDELPRNEVGKVLLREARRERRSALSAPPAPLRRRPSRCPARPRCRAVRW